MSDPQPITLQAEDGITYTLYLPSSQITPAESDDSPEDPQRGPSAPQREAYGSPFSSRLKNPRSTVPPQESPPPIQVKLAEIHTTLKGYAEYAIGAFRHLSGAEVDEMNLKFGIKINGQTGLPMLAQSGIEGDFQIEVKCKFPQATPERADHPGK